jgi:iron-sulfur cluster assembly protein
MVTTQVSMPVTVSERALAEIKKIQQQEQVSHTGGLRLGVKGGGCSGMTYVLNFDEPTDHDQVYEVGGVRFLIDQRHLIYLAQMHVDFQDGLNARGFTFQNPNATTTCGCGASFAV